MGLQETNVFKQSLIELSPLGCRIFRNNRGVFLTLDGGRKARAGLDVPGSSDGIGFTVLEITPQMVGKKLAVFTAFEAKSGKGRLSDDQRNFLATIIRYGGIAFSAYGAEEAVTEFKLQLAAITRNELVI